MSGARHRSRGAAPRGERALSTGPRDAEPGRRRWLGAVSGMSVLLLGGLTITGLGFAAAAVWHGGPSDECADGTPRAALTITAAPTLTKPIRALADAYGQAHRESGQPCTSITVVSTPSDRALDALTRAGTPGSGTPDVWIPESADWLELGRESDTAARQLPARATTIAGSPVVIAMPRAMAEELGWPEHHLSWAELTTDAETPGFWAAHGRPSWGEFRFAMANPENSAPSLRAVIGTVSAARGIGPAELTSGTFDQDRAAQATVLRLDSSVAWLPRYDSELFDAVRTGGTASTGSPTSPTSPTTASGDVDEVPDAMPSAFPALESDVITYNRAAVSTSTTVPSSLVASYPTDGSFTASVPYIVLARASGTASKRAAADVFLHYLQGDAGRRALSAAGLRTPAELAGGSDPAGLAGTLTIIDGVRTTPPKLASVDASDTVLGTARRFFRHARQRAAVLALIDTSGSMGLPRTDEPGRTRIEAAAETAGAGLGLFPPDSEVQLWQFAGDLPDGHRELAAMAPLNSPGAHGTHRDDLFAAGTPRTTGVTNLYATAVAAVRDRIDHYATGRLNTVIMFTDGNVDDGGAGGGSSSTRPAAARGPTLDQAVAALRAEADPQRPVQMIVIACDPSADMAGLNRLAAATGGHAYLNPDVDSMFDVYADALTHASG
ncbi:substrate-binding domain-containing protein [Frankia sp. AgKG'84/4]|uniref:substrate-binding domain-containing protein n=1 Tax=Frankia sp. AgKG'84/4 TaxID=573490 RepID=UPI00200D81EB|nr:substrate-binding domain-containing protein [Frankia sp. AgKG'84/4]MCL9796733.1 substrate-binding and VWA domain-containing protein [Frankia sp. AgKG'84/4]